ncbi:hypothetical protein Bbelb_101220 [Branchiostoma belcheri]|nr:hypothetical protein Bbelb_101220 [Branchiostoma belcheri]
MINDARPTTSNPHWKYVDDLNLGETRSATVPSQVQSDLDSLDTWAQQNSMSLNPKKCKAMFFCFMRAPPEMPTLTLGGQALSVVTQTKLLGLHIRSDLRWNEQVETMVSKSSKRLYLLGRLRRSGVPQSHLASVYCGYIRPMLEYAAPCWSAGLTKKQSDDIERIQKRACRIMMGQQFLSYTDALEHLGLQRLSERRQDLCMDFALKVSKSSRFSSWLPPARKQKHHRQLRHTRCYQLPIGTKRFLNSPVPAMLKLLNSM